MVRFEIFLAAIAVFTVTLAAPVNEDRNRVSNSGQAIELHQIATRSVLHINDQGRGYGYNGNGRGGSSCSAVAPSRHAKAIYFITNAANNSIVALKVAADGTLSDGSITATGGAGMQGIVDGAPAAPDSLFSQGAVKVAGNVSTPFCVPTLTNKFVQNLVAVNPGSNTVSMFHIDSADPTKLTMIGQPVDTLGEFPMSVTLSKKLGQACVANSGAKAGIACFYMSARKGLIALDTCLRSFNINQTTPPVGPTNTVSQTFFNVDSTALMTTVKGNPAVNNTGFLSVFPVVNGTVSTQDIKSSPAGTAVLFGTALIPNSNDLFVTDASFGSATLAISPENVAAVVASTKIADQSATCWATISKFTGSAFVTDVAVNHLVEVDTMSGQLIREFNLTNGNPGMIDLESAGTFIYALSPGNATTKPAVTVFDVSGGQGSKLTFALVSELSLTVLAAAQQIQNFSPAGVTDSAQGMAIF